MLSGRRWTNQRHQTCVYLSRDGLRIVVRWTGIGLAAQFMPGLLRQIRVAGPDAFQILGLELFEIEQGILRFVRRANQLVELDLHRFGVSVLRVLDEEHHQKRDDGGAGIDDKLPGVVEVEEGPAQAPDYDNAKGKHASTGPSHEAGCRLGKPQEPTTVV